MNIEAFISLKWEVECMNNRMGRIGKRGNEQKPKDIKYAIKRLWQYLYK